jgi:hypothetical protein
MRWKGYDDERDEDLPVALATFAEKSGGAAEQRRWESINQFVATAVAEKLSAMQTAEYFASRKARADFKAFDKIMGRRGGKRPRAGDEMPLAPGANKKA